MATLNVKNFPDDLYAALKSRAEQDRRSLAQEVIHLVQEAVGRQRRRSILELRGLGREVWSDVDADEYVRNERDSWR